MPYPPFEFLSRLASTPRPKKLLCLEFGPGDGWKPSKAECPKSSAQCRRPCSCQPSRDLIGAPRTQAALRQYNCGHGITIFGGNIGLESCTQGRHLLSFA